MQDMGSNMLKYTAKGLYWWYLSVMIFPINPKNKVHHITCSLSMSVCRSFYEYYNSLISCISSYVLYLERDFINAI